MQLTQDSRSALCRARFFLEKATAAPPDARVEFEAYLEAAIIFGRTALLRLESKHENHPKWKPWWAGLLRDASVKFFRVERNWLLHVAPPRIGQKVFGAFIGPSGEQVPATAPASAGDFYYFEDPDTLATMTVAKHLDAVAKVLADGEQLFASTAAGGC